MCDSLNELDYVKVNWTKLSKNKRLPLWFIERYIENLSPWYLAAKQTLTEEFILAHINKFKHSHRPIIIRQKVSETFIRNHTVDYIDDLTHVILNQDVSVDFMRDYSHRIKWGYIISKSRKNNCEKFNESFIMELKIRGIIDL